MEIHRRNLENLTWSWPENHLFWAIFEVLEARQVHGKVVLECSSKSAKYELQGSRGDPLYEHFCFDKNDEFIFRASFEISDGTSAGPEAYWKQGFWHHRAENHMKNKAFDIILLKIIGFSEIFPEIFGLITQRLSL